MVESSFRLHLQDPDRVPTSAALRLAWAVTLAHYHGTHDLVFHTLSSDADVVLPVQIHLDADQSAKAEAQNISSQLDAPQTEEKPETTDTWEQKSLLVIQSSSDGQLDPASYQDHPVVVACRPDGDEINLKAWSKDNDLEEWVLTRVLPHFAFVYRTIWANPNVKLTDIPTITPEEFAELSEWNKDTPAPVRVCVQDLILPVTQARPDKVAVNAWDGDFTYKDLDELSTHLAVTLVQLGVGPETFVPIIFEKSRWNVVATLGIIKAGAAFVPLDPSHPISRLQDIAGQTNARVVIASTQTAGVAANLTPAVVQIGDKVSAWKNNDGVLKDTGVGPDNALYAVFTSGTTGRPKGAILEHLQFSSLVGPLIHHMGLNEESRAFQFASHAFDLSISDILGTLIAGGCICIPSELDRTSNLVGVANALKVNIMTTTPSVHRLFHPTDVPGLRTIISCGEKLTAADLEHWKGVVRNLYGPVETTVLCTADSGLSSHRDIGRAFGCVTWIVDRNDHRKLAPIGAVGEILIQGANVARGYLHDAERTAKVFVDTLPWTPELKSQDGYRNYKTGDLGKYSPEGSLLFLERKDTQVKLHGIRIELAEIEHHLQESFGVVDNLIADVVTPPGRSGHEVLIAFVLKHGQPAEGPLILPLDSGFQAACVKAEEKLRARVPSYMIPAVFIPVSRVPLNVNGKTDRRRLREAITAMSKEGLDMYTAKGRMNTETTHKQQPKTETEELLQGLVAQSLETESQSIGMEDNFFYLGGDSTTAMKLVSLAREANLHFTVPDLVENPVLADLLALIEDPERNAAAVNNAVFLTTTPYSLLGVDAKHFYDEVLASQLHHLSFDDILDVFPMTDMQKRFYGPAQYYQLFLRGNLDRQRLRAAFDTLVKENAILRAVFATYKDSMIQVIPKQSTVVLQEYQCDGDLSEYVQTFCQEDVMKPIGMGVAPCQFSLVSHSPTENALVIRITHSQYDGVTLPILYRRLAALYRGEDATVITDFPHYLYQAETLKTPAAYEVWKDTLKDSSMSYIGVQETVREQATVLYAAKALPAIRPVPGITRATLIKAAWALTLSTTLEQEDVVFTQMVNGRGVAIPGIESVLGPCFNTIPVRVRREEGWTGLDLLQFVQNQHLKTMPHSSLGFETIKKNSTNWAPDTRMASVVVHQHFEDLKELDFDPQLHCSIKDFFAPAVPTEVVLYSEADESQWGLHLLTGTLLLGQEAFDALLGKTAEFIQALAAQPDRLLVNIVDK